jgi:hypothetical protein
MKAGSTGKRESKTPTEEVKRWSPQCSVFMTPELVNLSVLIQGPDLLVFLSTEKSSSQHQWNSEEIQWMMHLYPALIASNFHLRKKPIYILLNSCY